MIEESPRGSNLRESVKDRIRALVRETGFAEKTSVADFLKWRAAERADEVEKDSNAGKH